MSLVKRLKDADVKVLTLDIENAPNVVHTWGLFNQNIGINQIVTPASTFGIGYKWYHEKQAHFISDHVEGHEAMIEKIHALLCEADIVISYNGIGFDVPHVMREIAKQGLGPTSPFKQVDLLRVVRKQFRMTSNKLDYVADYFGLGRKTAHTGHQLWVDCLAGDKKAWALMTKYCKQDVVLTEKLYNRLLPWIPNHPHYGMWMQDPWVCPNCGGPINPEKPAGRAHTNVQKYNAYQCGECGHWSRGAAKKGNPIRTRSAR